ncbi:MAG: methylmalonyl Co-A mutase-associated GTPase MeaB [bacterium]
MNSENNLIEHFFKGDRRSLSRAISLVENEDPYSVRLLDAVSTKIGRAYRIGITGPPGAGKSTLVDELTKHFRKQSKTVGVIAVDPTSPFTGGALLGDRIRMSDIALDEGVFIRSMATRGSLGGLSQKADDVADILDAFGKNFVIIETVGVGQSELDVVGVADTTLVVLVPESGDAIQAMKAGLMEIADFFILNKADREGADRAMQEIQNMLLLRPPKDWAPKVLQAVASEGEGITEIAELIAEHRNYLVEKGILDKKRQNRLFKKIRAIVRSKLEKSFWDESAHKILDANLEKFDHLKLSPYKIAEQLLSNFKRKLEKRHES